MKRYVSMILAVILLAACLLSTAPEVQASQKIDESRAIAIVFDNSGSMYSGGKQAWCRATYAMEVFASMLNKGDVLQIYPMWPITVDGVEYTMKTPLQITDAAQASKIRDIYTPEAWGTPIESIDYAADGLQKLQADKKYLIVLTDGDTFSENSKSLESKDRTRKALDKRLGALASESMTVMYLGIDKNACIPNTAESEYFVKEHAKDTADVLSKLTEMCNLVFGRDVLPKNRISGSTMEFDISMKKLIVFVQGDNISNLKITGGSVGQMVSSQQTMYSTKGAGDKYEGKCISDSSLQGMMVTYTDCAAGTYNIEYTGTATSVEVYYEPDADLDFVFTDTEENMVDPQSLYEGDYQVSFGMKDAKTGKLISSDLLGNPRYQGKYYINGQEYPIEAEGLSGSVDIPLKMGDEFEANLSVTYLSGYTIRKDSHDIWLEGSITVSPKPAGEIKLEISGGDDSYSLQDLEAGEPYIAKVYYQGTQLTGSELEKVNLRWNRETSNAEVKETFADDHWKLTLHHKDPAAPENTVCGECTVTIYAYYAAPGSDEGMGQDALTYNIKDEFCPFQVSLDVTDTYIVIGDLDESKAIVVNLKLNGAPMNTADFAAVNLQADCGGIEHTVTPNPQDSSYSIKLLSTEGIKEGDYPIKVTAVYADHIGRETEITESVEITLSNVPLWVRWAIGLLILLLLLIIIWVVLHIKRLPKYLHTTRKLSSMNFDGDDVTQSTNFLAELKKKGVKVQGQYAGRKFGISMDVKPGKESYLYKPQKRRSAEVKVASVKKFGPAKIQEVMIGSTKFIADETTGKLVPALPNQKPFLLINGAMVKFSGTIQDAGMDKDFEVRSKLNFKKK